MGDLTFQHLAEHLTLQLPGVDTELRGDVAFHSRNNSCVSKHVLSADGARSYGRYYGVLTQERLRDIIQGVQVRFANFNTSRVSGCGIQTGDGCDGEPGIKESFDNWGADVAGGLGKVSLGMFSCCACRIHVHLRR